jgi:signal transduction histidine kinase
MAGVKIGRSLAISVGRLREHARAIVGGDLSRRVEVTGPAGLQELAAALNRLADEVQARDEYIRIMSHDLRAPLTVILGHAQLIQHGPDRVDLVLKSTDAIVTGVRRMNSMIQTLLDATRLETGQLPIQQTPLDLRIFISDLLERLEATAEAGRIRVEAPDGLPMVRADPNWLERIMLNLLSNALKYSYPETQVTVCIAEAQGEVITSVADRGPGIQPEELPELFQRFRRGRPSRACHEGLGLGLYIVKGLVEAQGGRVWVKSELGQGSVFSFSLPKFSVPWHDGAENRAARGEPRTKEV